MWSLLTFALDALAIAAQALTGKALGAADVAAARSATTTMLRWGAGAGVVLGALVLAVHDVLPGLFTTDPAVRAALAAALVVVALSQPVSGVVFVLDGVLIGAGDGRWLAGAQVVLLVLYVPAVLAVRRAAPGLLAGTDPVTAQAHALTALWWVFVGFMVLRGVALGWRARSDAWLVTGASRT